MLETKLSWQRLKVSSDQTHHLLNEEPAYAARFLSVLKFHAPGLAPVKDGSGAYHINVLGEPAYFDRFLQTFGFYEGRATVQTNYGWMHIFPDGAEVYQNRFAWCGNFQQGYCVIKDFNGAFFHIDQEGKKPYSQTFKYVGDFHDGFAVVQNGEGFHTHIDFSGNFLHGRWFIDLDIYHKGFARAKDSDGWFHIDLEGKALYSHHYKMIEHFYNGIARVETKLGALELISEAGEATALIREPLEDEFHHASAELVSYWRYYTLQAANEFQLFDHLPNSTIKLTHLIDLPKNSTLKLLGALQEMGFVDLGEDKTWVCTSKGSFFQSDHPYSLKDASRLWNEEHLISWRHIAYSLKSGCPSFDHLFGKGWFEWLKDHPNKSQLYHSALSTYAKRDYHALFSSIDFSHHASLIDVGGSTGALLFSILQRNSHLQGILFDLPNVIDLVSIPSHLMNRAKCVSIDFFGIWPEIKVESTILSRVLHDWSDEEVIAILKKVYLALSNNPDNRLYIIEKIQEEGSPNGALLDLNMLLMTRGVERTLKDFEKLLKQAGFILEKTKSLNQVSSILIARKEMP